MATQVALFNLGVEKDSEACRDDTSYDYLRIECIESRERLSEMDRALATLVTDLGTSIRAEKVIFYVRSNTKN
jgi:hypothetical protein